jgi:hypothetical protein
MAFVVAIIARSKGHHPALWLLYGLLIWPIALVHILVIERDDDRLARWGYADPVMKCPHCAEMIKREAKVCKHCGRDVAPAVAQTSVAGPASSERAEPHL